MCRADCGIAQAETDHRVGRLFCGRNCPRRIPSFAVMPACWLAAPIATHSDLPRFLTFANIRSQSQFPAAEVAGKFKDERAIAIAWIINPGKASFTVTTLLKNIIEPRRRTNDAGILCKIRRHVEKPARPMDCQGT